MPLDLPIATAAALLNGAIFLLLTARVIAHRRSHGIVLGDGGDRDMEKKVRGQGNAAEQMPLALIAIALVEAQASGAALTVLALVAALFTLGRATHAVYFTFPGSSFRFRMAGMLATMLAQITLLVLLLWVLLS